MVHCVRGSGLGKANQKEGHNNVSLTTKCWGSLRYLFQHVCRSTDPGRSANIVVPMFLLLRRVSPGDEDPIVEN